MKLSIVDNKIQLDNLFFLYYNKIVNLLFRLIWSDVLEVTFKNSKIKKICTEPKIASKKYSEPMADIIAQRIVELRASETIEELLKDKIGRCHSLKGDRKGQYAMDLIHPQRLVFTVHKKQIQIAKIIEIVDYH